MSDSSETMKAEELAACADASEWSPQHAARWWETHESGDPSELAARQRAERPVPATQSFAAGAAMQRAEAPRFM